MLPGRFVHRKEQSKYEVVTGPFVDKMGNGSDNYYKECTQYGIMLSFIHSGIV